MQYENRQPPEGINVSKVNPFTHFLKLITSALLFLVLLIVLLQFFGGALAKSVPFKYEKQLTDKFDIDFGSVGAPPEMVAYLNDLATRLAPGMNLTDGISVDVHYSDENVFNAFATVGGNLLFYRGLLKKMPSENAVAMVLAHEMAHVNHRDPVASLGGGVASMIAVSMFTGSAGIADHFFNKTYLVASTQFTRRMESAADTAALSAVNELYGHVAGASALFEIMDEIKSDDMAIPDWLERFAVTHPLSRDRINAIERLANENGWAEEGELTPLPAEFVRWLNAGPNALVE